MTNSLLLLYSQMITVELNSLKTLTKMERQGTTLMPTMWM